MEGASSQSDHGAAFSCSLTGPLTTHSGTGSARAALVDIDGNILSESTYATTTYRSDNDARIFEQSTTEIWTSISSAVKDVVKAAKVQAADIKGIGFDATCSLAVTDFEGNPMSVTPEPEGKWGKGERNIVLWADHRAEEEAALINSTGSMVLDYVGKTMSVSFVSLSALRSLCRSTRRLAPFSWVEVQ